tara:strand:+ start:109 stop:390 length:282 start_codon:yes stop_codon:yes gene_type:complete
MNDIENEVKPKVVKTRADLLKEIDDFAKGMIEASKELALADSYQDYLIRKDGSVIFRREPPLPSDSEDAERLAGVMKKWLTDDIKKGGGSGWV